jgi:hypothetical protein
LLHRQFGASRPLEVPLLDPQVARELGIITANLLNEALGVLAANVREPSLRGRD